MWLRNILASKKSSLKLLPLRESLEKQPGPSLLPLPEMLQRELKKRTQIYERLNNSMTQSINKKTNPFLSIIEAVLAFIPAEAQIASHYIVNANSNNKLMLITGDVESVLALGASIFAAIEARNQTQTQPTPVLQPLVPTQGVPAS